MTRIIKPLAKWTDEMLGSGHLDSSDSSSTDVEVEEEKEESKAMNPILDPLIAFLLQQQIGAQQPMEVPEPEKKPVFHKQKYDQKQVQRLPRNYRAMDNKKSFGRRKA